MAYAVVRTDNMDGTDVRAQLVSVMYMGSDGETETEIENGHVVLLGELIDDEREIHSATDVAADSDLKDVVLIASPEVMYDETKWSLDNFINPAGVPARGYRIHEGSTFSVTKDALAGLDEPAVGNIVELAEGTQLNVAESASGTQVGEIERIETVGKYTYYTIRVTE